MLRSQLILGVACAVTLAASGAKAEQPHGRLSPIRAVAQVAPASADFSAAANAALAANLLDPPDADCADSFRRDRIVVWSAAAGSKWHLLPPRPLQRMRSGR